MLTRVGVLPQPPLLLPALATGATAETAQLRAACVAVAARLAAAAPRWVAIGADPVGRRTVRSGTRGSFVGFGVDHVVTLGTGRSTGPVDPSMALPLLVAGWAAEAAEARVRIRGELVAVDESAARCAALGAELAAECAADPEPVGLLVLGDGAAGHTERAPGHLDSRSAAFDTAVAAALATADRGALAELDTGLAAELCAVGRAPWQVLAGATAGARWRAELRYSGAPYGVAYHVAEWIRR